MTVRYQNMIVADAPVFYWQADNTYADAMGNAADGVPVSGVFGSAKYGAAGFVMNGTSGHINVAHHALMDLGTAQDFSIELWATKVGEATARYLLDHRASANVGWTVYCTAVDIITLFIAGVNFAGPALPEDGLYHHVVIVADRDTNVVIYLDTVPTTVASAPNQNATSGSQLTIGGRSYTQPAFVWRGQQDEIAIYRKLLTQADVDRHYANRPASLDGMNGGFPHLAGGMN